MQRHHRILIVLILLVTALASPEPVYAQGPLCYVDDSLVHGRLHPDEYKSGKEK